MNTGRTAGSAPVSNTVARKRLEGSNRSSPPARPARVGAAGATSWMRSRSASSLSSRAGTRATSAMAPSAAVGTTGRRRAVAVSEPEGRRPRRPPCRAHRRVDRHRLDRFARQGPTSCLRALQSAWLSRSDSARPRMAPRGFRASAREPKTSMGLDGHGSNRDLEARLDRATARIAALEPGGGRTSATSRPFRQRRRPGDLEAAILAVLGSATELRARDIHAGVETMLGQRVATSSVKNWLARAASRSPAAVVQTARGRYRLEDRDGL
jgi:hypothetical protein